MDLTSYVETLRQELAVAAEAGGEDSRVLAERLIGPLESGVRLALLDALSAAAGEITREMAPGSVDLRLRGREPSFVVTLPEAERVAEPAAAAGAPPVVEPEEGAPARINFRLGEQLKGRIEEAASRSGLSVNAWLTRAATASLTVGDVPPAAGYTRAPTGSQRLTGWAR